MSYSKTIIMGRLANDPEVKTFDSGSSVCNFTVAYDTGWGDKKKSSFLECAAWSKPGEAINSYFHKGAGILIEGELIQETWEKDGKKNSKMKMNVQNFTFPVSGPKKEQQKKMAFDQDPESIPF